MEQKKGLYDNIHAKRKRIEAGSGERMRSTKNPKSRENRSPPKENLNFRKNFFLLSLASS